MVDEWRIKQKVQQQIERADSYFKQEAYEKALSIYEDVLVELEKTSFNRDKADLLRKKGTIQAKCNQREGALQTYKQAIDLSSFNNPIFNPMLPIFYKEQGEILLDLRQWEAAIKAYDSAIDLIGIPEMDAIEAAKLYENKGVAFIYMGRLKDALVVFDTAIQIQPDRFHLWQYRGEVCSEIGDIKEVKRSYEEAIRLAPDNAYLHHEYGKVLYGFQRYHEALGEYYKTLSYKQGFTQVYLSLSEVYTALAKQAQEEYERRKKDNK